MPWNAIVQDLVRRGVKLNKALRYVYLREVGLNRAVETGGKDKHSWRNLRSEVEETAGVSYVRNVNKGVADERNNHGGLVNVWGALRQHLHWRRLQPERPEPEDWERVHPALLRKLRRAFVEKTLGAFLQ